MRPESQAPFKARWLAARQSITGRANRVIHHLGICSAVILAACTLAERPNVPTENLLTPAVLPRPIADGESAPLQPPDAGKGAVIYEEKCAACHGVSGQGDGPRAQQIKAQSKVVANLVEPSRYRAARPGDWHQIITDGRIQNLMPPFGQSLDAQQRWDVQAYIWSLGSSPESLETGKAIYDQQCASCHGRNGEAVVGDPEQAFSDPRWLANTSLLDISSGLSRGDSHQGIALDELQRFQVADYVRSLAYKYADPEALRQARTHGDGVLSLHAVNGTPSGSLASNLPVTLRVYDANGVVFSRTNSLDDNHFVAYDNLPRRPDYFYQAELDYGGGRFYGAPMQFSITGTNTISDILPFYETTKEANAISVSEMHIFVQDVSEGTVTMVEYYLFDNAGDHAYIGEEGPGSQRRTLKLSVPKDAQNLRFDGLGLGRRFFQDGDVIYDSDVVVPGQRTAQVTMIYEVPYRNGRPFERQVFYPVRQWDVLVPEVTGPGTPLTVNGLTNRGLQQTPSGNLYLFVSDKPAAAGDFLKFELRGQPLGVDSPGADPRAIGFGFVAFGLAMGLIYFVFNRARAIRASQAQSTPSQLRAQLLRQIAALDDDFAQGKLKESAHRQQRERLKDELMEMWEVGDRGS